MNLQNVNKAIAIMTRVKERGDKFDLTIWQAEAPEGIVDNEAELHTCGTAACFAGWVAVSPEFQADGGEIEIDGSPVLHQVSGAEAIREWLGIPNDEAHDMCGLLYTHKVYGVEAEDEVTAEHVLEALYRLRDTGSAYIEETDE